MNSHSRTPWPLVAAHACLLSMSLACSGSSPTREDVADLGELEINLTALDQAGREYRLRAAQFVISRRFGGSDAGPSTIVVSSESALDDARLTQRLLPGSYIVELEPGWRMEEVTAGVATDVPAVLLSSQHVFFSIQRFNTTFVGYQFGVRGEPLDFGGEVSIGISVIAPDGGAP